MVDPGSTSAVAEPVPNDPVEDPVLSQAMFPLVYDELRALAGAMLREQRAGHTLQPTALVHEAYLRLRPRLKETQFTRPQIMALAARAMRTILIDHARRRFSLKRGGGRQRLALIDQPVEFASTLDVLAIEEALTRLSAFSERKARLVECRCLAGMTIEESAEALGIARSTAVEDWAFAKTWLSRQLREEAESE